MASEHYCKVAITGARGFVGRALVHCLGTRNVSAVALVRSNDFTYGDHPSIQIAEIGDLATTDRLVEALSGCTCVVHLADTADRHAAAHESEVSQKIANLLIHAMDCADIKRVVVASSLYARATSGRVPTAYGVSKLAMERCFQQSTHLRPIILRLPPVYGPGGRGGIETLAALIRRGVPLPLAGAAAPRSYISIDNLTEALAKLLTLDETSWEVCTRTPLEIADDRPIAACELARLIGEVVGQPAHLFSLPPAVLSVVGRLLGKREVLVAPFEAAEATLDSDAAKAMGWSANEALPGSLSYLARTK